MACASWITAVAATTLGDMSETTPGSSQHPDIPGASRPRLANTRRLAALQHAEQPNRTHQANMSRACKIEA